MIVPAKDDLFVDVSQEVGLDFVHFNGMSGAFYICEVKCAGGGLFDYDNDGDLDLYLIQGTMLGEGKTLADASFPPKGNKPVTDRVYRNDLKQAPDGTPRLRFTDVTESIGLADAEFGIGMATGDYDNDGWLDLYVSNFGPNRMYHNNRDGTFAEVTQQTGTEDAPTTPAPRSSTLIVMDGWICLSVRTSISATPHTKSVLWVPDDKITAARFPTMLFRIGSIGTAAMGPLRMSRPSPRLSANTGVAWASCAPTSTWTAGRISTWPMMLDRISSGLTSKTERSGTSPCCADVP